MSGKHFHLPTHTILREATMVEPASRRVHAVFIALWLFVMFVSVIDGYLVVRHRHDMPKLELNPVGRELIRLNGGRVGYLLMAKFAGTVVACAAMLQIFRYNTRTGLIVAVAVASFQFALLIFLLFV